MMALANMKVDLMRLTGITGPKPLPFDIALRKCFQKQTQESAEKAQKLFTKRSTTYSRAFPDQIIEREFVHDYETLLRALKTVEKNRFGTMKEVVPEITNDAYYTAVKLAGGENVLLNIEKYKNSLRLQNSIYTIAKIGVHTLPYDKVRAETLIGAALKYAAQTDDGEFAVKIIANAIWRQKSTDNLSPELRKAMEETLNVLSDSQCRIVALGYALLAENTLRYENITQRQAYFKEAYEKFVQAFHHGIERGKNWDGLSKIVLNGLRCGFEANITAEKREFMVNAIGNYARGVRHKTYKPSQCQEPNDAWYNDGAEAIQELIPFAENLKEGRPIYNKIQFPIVESWVPLVEI